MDTSDVAYAESGGARNAPQLKPYTPDGILLLTPVLMDDDLRAEVVQRPAGFCCPSWLPARKSGYASLYWDLDFACMVFEVSRARLI